MDSTEKTQQSTQHVEGYILDFANQQAVTQGMESDNQGGLTGSAAPFSKVENSLSGLEWDYAFEQLANTSAEDWQTWA